MMHTTFLFPCQISAHLCREKIEEKVCFFLTMIYIGIWYDRRDMYVSYIFTCNNVINVTSYYPTNIINI